MPRAYIAASRRSDRSLEARIESARRASEIHKKRTGRALRVTEQDVINEEMYEEEDDDLPTQYQRLNAHLHTTSVMFNKKLHDYIATQHGVRNMFMSQYQNPVYQQFGGQFPGNGAPFQPQTNNNWLNPATMLPPQQLSPTSPQGFQQAQPFSPTSQQQQQGFRQAPYHIPQRPQPHSRSLSIQLPSAPTNFDLSAQQLANGTNNPTGGPNRRQSLPPHTFEQQQQQQQVQSNNDVKPVVSPIALAQPLPQSQSTSPQSASPTTASVQQSPQVQSEVNTPTSYTYSPTNFPFGSQVLNTNPLTMSLPPESQQLIGSALDPNDPRTALFMAGSDNLPQPFSGTYTYNPNLAKPRISVASDSSVDGSQTLTTGLSLKLDSNNDPSLTTVPSAISEGFFSNDSFLTPGNPDYTAFFDFSSAADYTQSGDGATGSDQLDVGNSFVNWD